MSCVAAFNQKAFRGRNDDGSETTATWKAAQNTNFSFLKDTNLRVRFEIQETAACAGANKVWRLQYNKNAAGWVDVSAASTNVRASASPNLADAANLTNQLTVGTGTFIGATGFDEVDGNAGGNSMDVAASGHSEAEFCVQIRSADVASGDTIQLRITDAGAAIAAYDATPTVTVSSGAVSIAIGLGAVDLTGFAPTVLTPRTMTPGVGAIDLTGFAPTVTGGAGITASPGVGAVDLVGFAPTVQTPRIVAPGVGAVDLVGFAPTVQTPRTMTPGVGAVDLVGFAPTVQTPRTMTPGVGAVDLVGFAPTVQTPRVVTPGAGSIELTGYAPTFTAGGGGAASVTPGVGEITLEGFAPTVSVSDNAPAARRPRGSNFAWRETLAEWEKRRAEEDEEERKRREKELERLLAPIRAHQAREREAREQAARLEAEDAEACLVGALTGGDDEF